MKGTHGFNCLCVLLNLLSWAELGSAQLSSAVFRVQREAAAAAAAEPDSNEGHRGTAASWSRTAVAAAAPAALTSS